MSAILYVIEIFEVAAGTHLIRQWWRVRHAVGASSVNNTRVSEAVTVGDIAAAAGIVGEFRRRAPSDSRSRRQAASALLSPADGESTWRGRGSPMVERADAVRGGSFRARANTYATRL